MKSQTATPTLEEWPVAILAGGLATRLRPITETIPKALVPVAGEPFLAHQLRHLRGEGIRQVVVCVGYLGEMIEKEFADGKDYDLQLAYRFDGPRLLGTGGALKRALPALGTRFFVLYGDSFLPINYAAVANAFVRSGQPALMTVFKNEDRWDSSNVWFEGDSILSYDKQQRKSEMRHIDYGLGVLTADALERWPVDEPFDLANVYQDLVARNQLAGYEVKQRFYEIGSLEGLAELDALFREQKIPATP